MHPLYQSSIDGLKGCSLAGGSVTFKGTSVTRGPRGGSPLSLRSFAQIVPCASIPYICTTGLRSQKKRPQDGWGRAIQGRLYEGAVVLFGKAIRPTGNKGSLGRMVLCSFLGCGHAEPINHMMPRKPNDAKSSGVLPAALVQLYY